jgi:L-threonylcarbamoyladenylate synthase
MARELAGEWPALADRLADEFWPGPLTLVVRRSKSIPDVVTAGGDTVGLRWPMHPLMPAVIQLTGFPIAAPSANLANQLSPTCAAHVASQLGDWLSLIIDGGDCNVGIESTVVDVTGLEPVVLRPGIISTEAIFAAARGLTGSTAGPIPDGQLMPSGQDALTPSAALRSPGQLARHYAPRQRMVIWNWKDEADLHQQVAGEDLAPDDIGVIAYRHIPLSGRFPNTHVIPDDAEAYARALYGQLHQCDAQGYRLIIVEEPPDSPEWEGVRDRLRRGSTAGGG